MKSELSDGFSCRHPQLEKSLTPSWIFWLVPIWVVLMVYAFWHFIMLDSRLFYASKEKQLVEFERELLAGDLQRYFLSYIYTDKAHMTAAKGYVFHFYDSQCSCDSANQVHVKELIHKYTALGFTFVLVPKFVAGNEENKRQLRGPWQALMKEYPGKLLTVSHEDLSHLPIPASPSTAVLNDQGELIYFGPYALGGICKSGEDSLVETVLNNAMLGLKPSQAFVGGFGCFCRW